MTRIIFNIDDEMKEKWEHTAEEQHKSMASFIRDSVEECIEYKKIVDNSRNAIKILIDALF